MSATAIPTVAASRARPPFPTRYAAVMVFPCPGPNACSAPNPMASRTDTARTSGVNRQVTKLAKEPPEAIGAPDTVSPEGRPRAPPAVPGAAGSSWKARVASETSSGLESRSTG